MKFLFTISGRIGRVRYWIGTILSWAILIGVGGLSSVINPDPETVTTAGIWILFATAPIAVWIAFAVCIQRLHDRGKSGLWLLLALIPIVGELWLFIELGFFQGDRLRNYYGEPDEF
ncbi:MAG: DUF805 domain-containing protein [Verrucomicrobiota bacterium]